MYKYSSIIFCLIFGYSFPSFAQLCRLNAQFEERTSQIVLDWNMVSHTDKTTYILLRSTDTKTWTEILTDKFLQNYTKDDVFDYADKVNRDQKYYYRLQITGINRKTIAFSNMVAVSSEADKNPWVIYPNPVNDVLSIIYKGDNIIKGVINVTVQDINGKIVSRFRAASYNKKLQIAVSQLHKGIYAVQISIMNEIVMNQKFVKQ